MTQNGSQHDLNRMVFRRYFRIVHDITLALVIAGMPACSDSPSQRTGDGGREMDAELSDAALGGGGSGGGAGSGAAGTGASPAGSGGMNGGAAGSSASGGDASGGAAGLDASSTGANGGAVGADASSGTGGMDASTADGLAGDCADGGCVPEPIASHVHIYISNTCEVTVDPADVIVPQGQTVLFTYHNHSVDYEADVWMSYGGGYLGLVQGGTWTDPIERCSELFSYTAYADVSIHGLGVNDPYCPGQRMTIHCE